MHVGIDLGTSNSVLATFDGTTVSVVPSAHGESLTPSVVRVDARGGTLVGRRAVRFLDADPANTRAEFKRLMGTAEKLRFEASGRELLPEELSSLVLASLLADAQATLGYAPVAAVISTPALFELPQSHATARAGELAGLREVTLIQEPIASAIAAGWQADAQGFWLVYDLGGGTLDVSLLETRDGWLRVVDHGGDNFLGGRDFDNLLTDWAVRRLATEYARPTLERADPAHRRALAKLKAACEAAKIDLSRGERSAIVCPELALPGGDAVDVELPVTRADLDALVEPLVERSLDLCRSLLERQRLAADAVERLVFVGGPTLTPLVRARVGGFFGDRVAAGIDPMTLVARGAALYAATVGLEAKPAAPAPAAGMVVRVEHPLVTADGRPFVVGRFLPPAEVAPPVRVRLERLDGGFVTGDVEVSPAGTFVTQLELVKQQQNRFRLLAFDAGGGDVALRTNELAIVHGISIADPPLARSIGVASSDDHVRVYFTKGTPLPARRMVILQTVQRVSAGAADEAVTIPLVQGERSRAHRNRLIGSLEIRGERLRRDLPVGARIEVTLELDRSGQMRARADLPTSGESFEDVVHVLVPKASPEVLAAELAATERRVAEAQRRGFASSAPELLRALAGAPAVLAEARSGLAAAQGGDADAAARVQRLLLDLSAALEEAEAELDWPAMLAESERAVNAQLHWIGALGTPSEQQLADRALAAIAAARTKRDAAELDRQLATLRALGGAAFARDPRSPVWELEWYEEHVGQASDPQRALTLLAEARHAAGAEDLASLRKVNRLLDDLFPGSAEERQKSFGSGVR